MGSQETNTIYGSWSILFHLQPCFADKTKLWRNFRDSHVFLLWLWLSTANCAAMRKRQLCEWPGNCVYYTFYTITRIYMASGLASLQQWEVNDWIGLSQEQQIYRRKHRNTVVDENSMNKHKPWFSLDFPQTKSLNETLQKPRAGPHMIPQALLPVAVKVTSLWRMTSNIWSSIAATWRFTFLCGCISRSYMKTSGEHWQTGYP